MAATDRNQGCVPYGGSSIDTTLGPATANVDLTLHVASNEALRSKIAEGDDQALVELARREFNAEVIEQKAAA